MKNLLYIITIGLLSASCVPDPIDIKIDEAPTKLVVSSQVIPSSIMIVTVSKSFGALSYSSEEEDSLSQELIDQLLVDSANVTISYDGITEQLFPISNTPGVYWSFTTPQILNTTYTLNVYDPETDLTVSSSAEMLAQVELDTTYGVKDNSTSFEKIVMSYQFTDPSSEANWYMLNFYAQNNDSVQSGSPFNNEEIPTQTLLLSDQTFGSSAVSGTVDLFDWPNDTVFVSLSNISQDYFDYLSARQKSGNLFTDIVKEPITYPSNIEGGYGYFTTHFPDVRVIIAQ